MTVLILFLKNNWKLILLGVVIFLIFLAGLTIGSKLTAAKYELQLTKLQQQHQNEVDQLQASADHLSGIYETQRKEAEDNINQIKKRFDDDKNKNPNFNACHAGPEFVQLYKQLTITKAGSGSKSAR